MTEIRETKLPGVGLRFDFDCDTGDRVGVVTRHGGHRDLVVYDHDDPDSVKYSIELTEHEASNLADMLGGTTVTERLDDLRHEIAGLALDWITVPPDADAVGRSIGDNEVRARTGVSIVAIVRGGNAIPAPGPDESLLADDVAVVVGTPEAVQAAEALLGSPATS